MSGKDSQKVGKKQNNTQKGPGSSLKEREKKRKQVFKPILDNVFTQANWPFIEPELGNSIIESLEIILNPIKQHNDKPEHLRPTVPDILKQITIGFNATTKAMENQAQKVPTSPIVKYAFVCKADIPNGMVVQHFPVLTYTSSKGISMPIKLIQLPRGSSHRISQVLGEKDVTVIGLSGDIPGFEGFYSMFDKVSDISVPFLEEIYQKEGHFKPPAIKFISTTTPMGPSQKKANRRERKKQKKEKKLAQKSQKGQKSQEAHKSQKA